MKYTPLEQFKSVEEAGLYRVSTLHIPVLGDPVRSGDFYGMLKGQSNYFLQGDYIGKHRPDVVIQEYDEEMRRMEAILKQVDLTPKEVILMLDGWFETIQDMHEEIGCYSFFSLSCSRLNEDGAIRYSSAGHEYPFLLNGDAKPVRRRSKQHLVGLKRESDEYQGRNEYEIELPEDGKLVVITDGWPDMKNGSGRITHKRVRDLLQQYRRFEGPKMVDKLSRLIEQADKRHYKDTKRHGITDDITVSVIERS